MGLLQKVDKKGTSLVVKVWLRNIMLVFLSVLPAFYKIVYGKEYYSVIDILIAASLWIVILCLILDQEKYLFYMRISSAMISIVAIFFIYAFLMAICLPIVSANFPLDDHCVGFSVIILGVLLCSLLVLFIFRKEAKECEKHYRLIADAMTVVISIVVLYKGYYGVNELVNILFLNEGFVGFPIIIYTVRFLVSANVLHNDDKKSFMIDEKSQ